MTLINEILTCQKCVLAQRGSPIKPLWFSKTPEYILVFETPKQEEALIGEPISILEKIFLQKSIDLKKVYITTLVKCPARNKKLGQRLITQQDIDACVGWLKQEIEHLKPKKIIGFGNRIHEFIVGDHYNRETDLYSTHAFLGYEYHAFPNLKYALGRSKKELVTLISNLRKEVS